MDLKPQLGMYGGGIDPPHNAHGALARAAITQLRLDRLFVVPTGDAYHKVGTLSAGVHRRAMCELAFADLPAVTVSGVELARSGSSYSFDTLAVLRAAHPGARWFLIIGADQALAFRHWYRWADILQQTTVAIAARPAPADDDAAWRASDPLPGTGVAVSDVRILDFAAMDCSASAIRCLAGAGESVARWVPAPVARYIDTHHLYLSKT